MTFHSPVELRAGDFYVQKMMSAYIKNYRVLTIENATRQEQEIWQEVQLDAGFRHSMETARKMIIGKEWRVEAFDSSKTNRDIASIYRRILKKTKSFRRFLFAASEFSIRGESWGYPEWANLELDVLNRNEKMTWAVPSCIKHIDRYRIRKINNEDFSLDYEVHSLKDRMWKPLEPEDINNLIYFNNSSEEWRFTHGHGLLDSIFWCWYAKKIVEGELLNLCERYGQGMLLVKVENLKLGSKDRKLQVYAEEILKLFEFMKARHVAVCGKSEDIQVVEPSGSGYQVLKELIDYYDNKVLSLCLGANLAVQSVQTGSYMQAVVHQDTSYQYIGYERSIMEDAITDSLFENIWYYNRPQFEALGLAGGEPPRFRIVGHRNDTPLNNLDILRGALNDLRMPVLKTEAYELLNLTQPIEPDYSENEEGDDVLLPEGMEFGEEGGQNEGTEDAEGATPSGAPPSTSETPSPSGEGATTDAGGDIDDFKLSENPVVKRNGNGLSKPNYHNNRLGKL